MKRAFVFLLTFLFVAQAGFAREYSRDELLARQQKFARMKSTGFTMGGIGAAMLVGGIVLAANGEWETTTTPTGGTQSNAQDASAGFGLLFIALGIPTTVTGLILGGIGSRKVNQYQDLLESTDLGLELGPDRKGLKLSYRF